MSELSETLKRLDESLTQGQWRANVLMVVAGAPFGMYGGQEICHFGGSGRAASECESNAANVATLRNLLPTLIAAEAERERLAKENTELKFEAMDARDAAGAVMAALEWTGDGYSWNPQEGDYREDVYNALARHTAKMKAERERLREALAFYADERRYEYEDSISKFQVSSQGIADGVRTGILDDEGTTARAALQAE